MAVGLATPAQLLPEGRVVAVSGDASQLKEHVGTADVDGVARPERALYLSVDDEHGTLGKVVAGERVLAVGTIDQWAIGQCVWVQRSHDKRL